MSSTPERTILYAEMETYERHTIADAIVSRNRSWVIAFVSLCLAIASIVSLAMLVPLKRIEPIVIEVNKNTGETQILTQYHGDIRSEKVREVLAKYWVNKFIHCREGYDPQDIEETYLCVKTLSTHNVFNEYGAYFTQSGDSNWLEKYGNNPVLVDVKSITPLKERFIAEDNNNNFTYNVRFTLTVTSTSTSINYHYLSVLTFHYRKIPQNEQEIRSNPMGFKVTRYRRDQEVIVNETTEES